MKWSRVKTWSHCQPSDFSSFTLICQWFNQWFLESGLLDQKSSKLWPLSPVKPTFDRCFEDMVSQGCQGDVASFSSLVHACAKSNQLPRAEGWIKRMEEAGGSWWVDPSKKGNYAEFCRLIWVAQIFLPLCPLEFVVERVSIKSLVFFSLKSSFLRIFPGDQVARPPRTQWAPKLLFFCRWVWKPMWWPTTAWSMPARAVPMATGLSFGFRRWSVQALPGCGW